MKVRTEKVIDCFDLDELVVKTYGRPYCFQQQEDCRSRGVYSINVPTKYPEDFDNDTIPEIVNHNTQPSKKLLRSLYPLKDFSLLLALLLLLLS